MRIRKLLLLISVLRTLRFVRRNRRGILVARRRVFLVLNCLRVRRLRLLFRFMLMKLVFVLLRLLLKNLCRSISFQGKITPGKNVKADSESNCDAE